jgi:hypothetical protein
MMDDGIRYQTTGMIVPIWHDEVVRFELKALDIIAAVSGFNFKWKARFRIVVHVKGQRFPRGAFLPAQMYLPLEVYGRLHTTVIYRMLFYWYMLFYCLVYVKI